MRRTVTAVSLLTCLLASAAYAQSAVQSIEIREWPVPWQNTGPRDPFTDARGRVWFVGQRGNYLAYFDPAGGAFKRYEIEEGTHPHNLIVDSRGVWYAGNSNARIGKLDPETGKLTIFPMPDSAARDPHTLIFDKTGDIWFTVQGGNFVGKLDTKSGQIRLIRPPVQRGLPYGIVMDPEGHPWVDLFGTNKLGTIDPATMQMRTIDLPRGDARPRRIVATSDGMVWYVDYAGGMLGRLNPKTSQIKEWPSPSGAQSRPYAMAVDDKDRIWYVETGVRSNKFVGFDPTREVFFSITDIPSGGGSVRHMMFDARTRLIWFGTDTGTIGRAAIP